ncbi:hypothetical protein GCM10008941_24600 [Rhizomicrobium palustre]
MWKAIVFYTAYYSPVEYEFPYLAEVHTAPPDSSEPRAIRQYGTGALR